jgi:hypothetical protein
MNSRRNRVDYWSGALHDAREVFRPLLHTANATAVPPLLSLMKQRVGASGPLNSGNAGAKPDAHASTWCGACPPPAAVPPATWDRLRAAAADWSRSHGSWTGNHSGFVRRAGAGGSQDTRGYNASRYRVANPRANTPPDLPARNTPCSSCADSRSRACRFRAACANFYRPGH